MTSVHSRTAEVILLYMQPACSNTAKNYCIFFSELNVVVGTKELVVGGIAKQPFVPLTPLKFGWPT